MRILLCFVFALTVSVSLATARSLSLDEQASLDIVVEQFVDDMQNGNMKGIIRLIPPGIIDETSRSAGMPPAEFRELLAKQMAEIMAEISINSVEINVTNIDVTDATYNNGTNVVYGFIPYSFSFDIQGKTSFLPTSLIALHENGKWYLIRPAPQQRALLIELYPFLKDLSF